MTQMPARARQVPRMPGSVLLWITAVLTMALLSARAQAQDLTSYSDSRGKHVVYVANDGHVHQRTCGGYCLVTSSWFDEDLTQLTGGPSIFSAASSNLTSFSDFAGEHVFYRDPSTNHINHFLFAGGGWHNQDLGFSLSGATVTSGYSAGGIERLFYITVDTHVHMLESTNGLSWVHSDLTLPTGGTAWPWGGGATTSFHDALGEHLFYVGVNEQLYQLYGYWYERPVCFGYPNPKCYLRRFLAWVNQDLGGQPETGRLSSFSDAMGGEHVFYFHYDYHQYNDHIYEHYNAAGSSGWVDNDWGTAFDSSPFGDGQTSFNSSTTLLNSSTPLGEQLFHVDNYPNPLHLYQQSGTNGRVDLNLATNAPPVSLSCAGLITSFADSSVWEPEDVFYAGTDGDLHP